MNACYIIAVSADFYRGGLEHSPLVRSPHRTSIQKTYIKFKALQRPLGNHPILPSGIVAFPWRNARGPEDLLILQCIEIVETWFMQV